MSTEVDDTRFAILDHEKTQIHVYEFNLISQISEEILDHAPVLRDVLLYHTSDIAPIKGDIYRYLFP